MKTVAVPKFEDPSLSAVFCAIKFQPSPLFPDRRGALAKELMRLLKTDEWRFNSESLEVANEKAKRFVSIEPSAFIFMAEDPGGPEAMLAEIEQALMAVSESLELSEFSSPALNAEWLVGLRVEKGATKWLRERMGLAASNDLFDPFGGGPTSFKCEFRFEIEKKDDEVAGFQLDLSTTDAEDAADDAMFDADKADFPGEAVKVGVWHIDSEDLKSPDDAVSRIASVYHRAMEAGDRVTAQLHEEL